MKYIVEFKKTGVICYTSHLDILRVFKRVLKRAGLELAYSQGFNPHAKMGFAQPLSLGYSGLHEYMEFETVSDYDCADLLETLKPLMPEGLELVRCLNADWLSGTLAAGTTEAEYTVTVPVSENAKSSLTCDAGESSSARVLHERYMGQESIEVLKKQKKKKGKEREMKLVDIKPMIRSITFNLNVPETLEISMILDQGSQSNLSPELVISSVLECFGLNIGRNEIDVIRNRIGFTDEIEKNLK